MSGSTWSRLTLVVLAIGLAACGSNDGEPTSEGAPTEGTRGTTGVVTGVVRLAEGAELPAYADHPMRPPGQRPSLPDACTPPREEDRHPVRLGSGRALGGVLVALSEFDGTPEHEPVTHTLTIEDCRLGPRLVVATRGDRLQLRNQTDYPFLPDLGTGLMQALLHEQTRELELAQGGVQSLTCGFAAPCGRADVVTLYHPLHAITDDDGRFRIENVPPGAGIRVSAWHPVTGEAATDLEVTAGEAVDVTLTITPPTAPPAAPAPGEAPTGPAENDPSGLF